MTSRRSDRQVPPPGTPERAAVMEILAAGEIIACQPIPRGSNYTFAVALARNGSAERLAIYKPEAGEVPLWDFPDGTLYRREFAAYVVSEELGWDFIPPTVIRDGPHGIGSVQLYVEPDPTFRFFESSEQQEAALARIAVFDFITNNADRKAGHCIKALDGRIWAIDHGLTFHTAPKLRTVLWDFFGRPVPQRLLDDLRVLLSDAARVARLRALLGPHLTSAEIEAFLRRAERLVRSRRFPNLDPNRSVPWPPF